MIPAPPRLATRLLTRRLPREVSEFLLGDMEERFQALHAAGQPGRAWCWYWKETALACLRRWPAPHTAADSRGRLWAGLLGDLRHGLRVARRAPLFASLVILTFALGLGAAGTMFSVLQPVLLSGAPYPHAERLLLISDPTRDGELGQLGYETFHNLRQQSRSLERSAAMAYWTPVLTGNGDAARLLGQRVTHDFFQVLGVRPALGRDFLPTGDVPAERNGSVILSHGLWQSRFGGDSAIIGRTIQVSDRAMMVIGVMPRSFESLILNGAELWAPLGYAVGEQQACRDCRHLRMIARLAPGVSLAAARQELHQLSVGLVAQYPTQYAEPGFTTRPLNEALTRSVRPVLLAITSAVALLLLIACVNVTNLFLGRALLRSPEFAVRSALGAGSLPLIRQVIAEGVVLALVGGVVGVGLAYAGTRLVVRLAPAGVPRMDQVALNGAVLGFTLLLATVAGILAGVAPAIAARRANLAGLLRQGGRSIIGALSRRVRAGLVVVEVAIALVLLTGAGLLLRSLGNLLEVPVGFRAEGVVAFELQTFGSRYFEDDPVYRYFDQVVAAVRAVPGVTNAAVTSQLPLSGDFDTWGIHPEFADDQNPALDPSAFRFSVSPGYLETMEIPVLRGRGLTPQDDSLAPQVAVINSVLARRRFPGTDPIGQRIRIGGGASQFRTVVGIVGDVRHQGLDAGEEAQVYLPTVQHHFADSRMVLVVRGTGALAALVPAVRAAIRGVDPTVPIATVNRMTDLVAQNAATRRFALTVFQGFGLAALLLAALGLYGVLAASVTERTREIGIRSALGASRGSILGLVARSAFALTGLGVVLGVGGALVGTELLTSLLYGVTPTDRATLVAVGALLLVVALAAAVVPAWRAVRVDPVVALREE